MRSDQIWSVAASFLNCAPDGFSEIVGRGTQHRIFVATLGARKIVLRATDDPGGAARFEKETWCLNRARAAGISAPEPLGVAEWPTGVCLIQSFERGENASAAIARNGDPKFERGVWRQLGAMAKAVHEIPVAGFGETRDDLATEREGETWRRFLDYNLDSLSENDPLRALGVLDTSVSETLRTRWETLGARPFVFGLNHGDLTPRNLLLGDSGAAILLDWECAEAHIVPHYELIRLTHWEGLDGENLRAFRAGYGIDDTLWQSMRADLDSLALLKAVDLVRWAIDRNPASLGEHVERAKRILQSISSDQGHSVLPPAALRVASGYPLAGGANRTLDR